MGKLPVVSGQDLIRALQTAGFQVVRQKGSHVSLQKHEFRTVRKDIILILKAVTVEESGTGEIAPLSPNSPVLWARQA